MPLDTIHDFNCQLLAELPHQRYQHEPILDYATDERVRARLGWQAVFSKTLFLKFKDGRLMQPELCSVWDDKSVQFRGEIVRV